MRRLSLWSVGPAASVVVGVGFAVVTLVSSPPTAAARPVAARPAVARALPPQNDLGAELFATQCSSCHGLDGLGVDERGPSLATEGEAATDFVLRTGRMPLAAPDLQARRGPVRYSEEEIVALVGYVGSIGTGPGIPDVDPSGADVANGGDLYRLNCAACHVSSGAGAPIGGGQVAPNVTEATPVQIGEAIRVGPGAMPVFNSLTDTEVDDIAAYIGVLDRENTTGADKFGGAGPVAEGLAAWLLALVPLVLLTRWIGGPKEGRDRPLEPADEVSA